MFGVGPKEDGAYTCPSNLRKRTTVVLPEPLGNRRLLDGSCYQPSHPVADR